MGRDGLDKFRPQGMFKKAFPLNASYIYFMKTPTNDNYIESLVSLLISTIFLVTPFSDTAYAQQVLSDPPTAFRSAPQGTGIDRPGKNLLYACSYPADTAGVFPAGTTFSVPDNYWVNLVTEGGKQVPYVNNSDNQNVQIPTVQGNVYWGTTPGTTAPTFSVELTRFTRHFKGNGVPSHVTGVFPVQSTDRAYPYYSSAVAPPPYQTAADIPIGPYDLDITVPRYPVVASKPNCIDYKSTLVTGVVTQTGATWHINIASGNGTNLVDPITALPPDQCWGHPYNLQYHYHGYSWKCFPNQGDPKKHSPLFGYALDGFGIFGPRGDDGKIVTNDDLDECHGHKHIIKWDDNERSFYHYHLNNQFPYGPGCFKGTPAKLGAQFSHDATMHRASSNTKYK